MDDDTEPVEKGLAPRAAQRDTEKALGLEVARLFGLSPRLLVAKASPAGPAGADDRSAPAAPETADDRTGAPETGGTDPE